MGPGDDEIRRLEVAALPKREAAMALAGPATSAVLGGAFVALSRATRPAGVADAEAKLADLLHLLGEVQEIAVVDVERLVGTLSQLDLVRGLELRELAAPAPAAGGEPALSGAEPRRGAL